MRLTHPRQLKSYAKLFTLMPLPFARCFGAEVAFAWIFVPCFKNCARSRDSANELTQKAHNRSTTETSSLVARAGDSWNFSFPLQPWEKCSRHVDTTATAVSYLSYRMIIFFTTPANLQ